MLLSSRRIVVWVSQMGEFSLEKRFVLLYVEGLHGQCVARRL